MALVGHACKTTPRRYHFQWSKCMDKCRKMEGDHYGQRRTTFIPWKEGVTPSDIRRRLSAIGGQIAPPHSTVFSWVRDASSGRRLSVCGIATSLKNGTLKPSEALKEMAAKYRPKRGMCWFSGGSILRLKITNCCKRVKSKSFPNAPRILVIKLRFR